MANEKEIIIDFKINPGDSLSVLNAIDTQMRQLQADKKELDKVMKDGTATDAQKKQYVEIEASLKALRKQRMAEQKELYNEAQQYRFAADTMQGMKDRLRQMKDEYVKMSEADRNGKLGKDLARNIRQATNELEAMNLAIKPTIFDKLRKGIKAVGIAVKTNPIGAILTALIFIFQKLRTAIQGNEQAMKKIQAATQAFYPIVQFLQGILMKIVDVLTLIISKITEIINKILDSKFGKWLQKITGIQVDTKETFESVKEAAEAEEEAAKAAEEAAKEAAERAKEFAAATKELNKDIEDLSNTLIKDAQEQELAILNTAYERQVEEYKQKYAGQKRLNELLLQLKIKHGEDVKKINDKYNQKEIEDAIKAQEEKYKKINAARALKTLKEKELDLEQQIELAKLTLFANTEEEKARIQKEAADKRFKQAQDEYDRLQYLSTEEVMAEFGASEEGLQKYQNAIKEAHLATFNAAQDVLDAQNAVDQAVIKTTEDQKQQQQQLINTWMTNVQALQGVVNGFADLFTVLGEDNQEYQEFVNALAYVDIMMSMATGIASAIAQANSVPFPANIAAMAAGVSAVVGGITQAISIYKKNNKVQNAPRFSEGGLVGDRTTTRTDDTIVARLSEGEYVINSQAVKNLGVAFLDRLNGGKGDRTYRFASGGSVSPSLTTIQAIDSQMNMNTLQNMMAAAVENIHPVVSVKEINSVNQRVAVKENISRTIK